MKLSQVADKVTLPFKKNVYRLYRYRCGIVRVYMIVRLRVHACAGLCVRACVVIVVFM